MEKLLLFAPIASLMGISLLLIISITIPLPNLKIKDIPNYLDQKIKISGEIKNIKNFDNFQIITLEDSTGKIQIISKKQNITKNQKIIVIGKVEGYNNTLEINSEKLYIISLKLS